MRTNVSKAWTVALLVASWGFVSCIDSDKNLFDAEKTEEMYQNSFPVKNVDPSMTWKTTQNVAVNVTVNEDWGTDYKVQIFDANPLDTENNAKLLGEGYANQKLSFETTIDCPQALQRVYVARIDGKGRYLIKPTNIKNKTISASFGKEKAFSRSLSRAATSTIPTMEAPYTTDQVKELINRAALLTSKTTSWDQNVIDIGSDQEAIYKVKQNLRCAVNTWGNATKTIIVTQGAALTLAANSAMNGGLCLLIDNGTITFEGEKIYLPNGIYFIVYENGKLTGNELTFSDNSEGKLNYNAGDIDLKRLTFSGAVAGTFYNCGEVDVKLDLVGSNPNFTLVNRGEIDVEGNLDLGSIADLKSACSIEVKHELRCENLVIGKNSKVKCGSFTTDGARDQSITMEPASMLECEGQATLNRIITGPSATEDYALIQVKNIKSGQDYTGNDHSIASGNLYFAVNQQKNNDPGFQEFIKMLANSNLSGSLCKEKEAPFIMDEDECTGNGYHPGEGGTDVVIDPISYSYAFEDNFPLVGDYDFNDIVLKVSTGKTIDKNNNTIKSYQYDITLSAIGASRQLGAGLRLVGVDKNAIEEIRFEGDQIPFREKTLPNSMFENAVTESKGNEVVIPLFGDAHKVYKNIGDKRTFINTVNNDVTPYTLKIIITPKNPNQTKPLIAKDNLDFFIAYGRFEDRTEVHLYEFRGAKATANGNIHQMNLDVAGNLTWAISVPNFRYPKEGAKITNAYPEFSLWAANGGQNNQYEGWYNTPDEKYIFK